ncbi:MAG: MATE family efflux transporter [Lachnospiraceae bacterium]|nr:MATE family efflux transporter [Lachnospiraceae bacterium]
MKNKAKRSLTEGPILQVLAKLALPIMASSFLSTAYGITDMAWIGKLGSKAVAGVGVGGMYMWLSSGLVSLAKMGGQVKMAQEIGAGNEENAKKYAHAALWLTTIFGIVFGLVCMVFTDGLIALLGIDEAVTVKHADIYMKITCGLVIFAFLGRTLTGLYTAQGDSRTPLKANVVGLVTNMVLDPMLILGFGPIPKMGVFGAALATVFSQLLVVLVLVWGIAFDKKKSNVLRGINYLSIPDMKYISGVIKIGTPTALQSMLYCIISMILTRFASVFGEDVIATQRVGEQIESISWNTADGFAAAMNAFAAQNFGAMQMKRIKKGYKLSVGMLLAWGCLVAFVFIVFPRGISEIFFYEANAISYSIKYLMIIGISEPFMCIELLATGAISGMGNTKICSIISIIFTGLRIPLALVLMELGLGILGIWLAIAISSVIKGIVLHIAFYRVLKLNANLTTV